MVGCLLRFSHLPLPAFVFGFPYSTNAGSSRKGKLRYLGFAIKLRYFTNLWVDFYKTDNIFQVFSWYVGCPSSPATSWTQCAASWDLIASRECPFSFWPRGWATWTRSWIPSFTPYSTQNFEKPSRSWWTLVLSTAAATEAIRLSSPYQSNSYY